jgi:hypothetical protein
MGYFRSVMGLGLGVASCSAVPVYIPFVFRSVPLCDSQFYRSLVMLGGPLDGDDFVADPWLREGEDMRYVYYGPLTAYASAQPDGHMFPWCDVGEDLSREVHRYRCNFVSGKAIYGGC